MKIDLKRVSLFMALMVFPATSIYADDEIIADEVAVDARLSDKRFQEGDEFFTFDKENESSNFKIFSHGLNEGKKVNLLGKKYIKKQYKLTDDEKELSKAERFKIKTDKKAQKEEHLSNAKGLRHQLRVKKKLSQAEAANEAGKRKKAYRKFRRAKRLEWRASEERKSGVKFKEYFSKDQRKTFKAKTDEAGEDNLKFRSEQIGLFNKSVEENIVLKYDDFIQNKQLAIGSAPNLENNMIAKDNTVGEVPEVIKADENLNNPDLSINSNLTVPKRDPLLRVAVLSPGQTGNFNQVATGGKINFGNLPARTQIAPAKRAVPNSIGQ